MTAHGWEVSVTVKVQLRGQMAPSILVSGVTDSPAKRERSATQLETITKAVGPTTNDVAQEPVYMLKDQFILESGSTDFSMAMDTNHGKIQMKVENTKVTTDLG
jgi:hypothetical protein